jgi:hypothetical protein
VRECIGDTMVRKGVILENGEKNGYRTIVKLGTG